MTQNRPRIVLAGGSGFLGRLLARWFVARGSEVVVLSRRPGDSLPGVRAVAWDGVTLGSWSRELDGAIALINLAGRSVNCRYHARNRRAIMDSRVASTRVLGQAIAASRRPPPVWLNSSTATIYKHSLDRPMDEATGVIGATAEAKDAFSIEVARAWEESFQQLSLPATRKGALRTAMVLGAEAGSVFVILRRLARWGLGGPMGTGRQFVSWIHEVDFCRAVDWLIERVEIDGPVNLAAPHPLPNAEVMRLFRTICGFRFGLPAPAPLLEVGTFLLRTESELVIKSRRVVPGRLLDAGFAFLYPEMENALRDLEERVRSGGTAIPPHKYPMIPLPREPLPA